MPHRQERGQSELKRRWGSTREPGARGAHQPSDGRYVKADGIRWTGVEAPVATHPDAPLALADLFRIPPGEPMFTYNALQTADHCHLRQLHWT